MLLIRLCFILVSGAVWAIAQPARTPLAMPSPVQDKNFYLLSMLERTGGAKRAVQTDAVLKALAATKREGLTKAAGCAGKLDCIDGAFRLTDAEIDEAREALVGLYRKNEAVRRLVDGELRRCGLFVRYADLSGEELLAKTWSDAAKGLNRLIDVYLQGKAPRYPAIDSVSYDAKGASHGRLLDATAAVMEEGKPEVTLFFQPALRFGMALLDINRRDEAGRHEPMEAGENAAAFRRMRTIDWARYPYSAIVVPGSGTESLTVRISAYSKIRAELAARRFREGKAPLIIVSGGYVHPNQTPFSEAVEMKRWLMTQFRVPESAILIDPHARHTTTNLRNAARLMYRYGAPFGKTALITTDQFQSAGIESKAFTERCNIELGYQPHQLGKRVSRFDLEFVPKIESLQADATDPLDP